MKIWYGYGSEHSAKLVLIGRFRSASDAEQAASWIPKLADVSLNGPADTPGKFTDEMMDIMRELSCFYLSPEDFANFAFDHHVQTSGKHLTITTDEIDIGAFVKLFVHFSAKIEVYSRHDYPEEQ